MTDKYAPKTSQAPPAKKVPLYRDGVRYRLALVGFIVLWLGMGSLFVARYFDTRKAHDKACAAVAHSNDATVLWLQTLVNSGSRRQDPAAQGAIDALRDRYAEVQKNC